MIIKIITTGGTIDKIYFDAKGQYQVGEPQVGQILKDAAVAFDYKIVPLLNKDSLEITDDDRRVIRQAIESDPERLFVITHGTDTMVQTAKILEGLTEKVIVLTGALEPAKFKTSDAVFNVGSAVAAVQILQPGVYIAMNGRIYDPKRVTKNPKLDRFEEI